MFHPPYTLPEHSYVEMDLTDLPDDVLALIFAYLNPKDFLSLCRSTKALYKSYRQDSTYWRTITSTTFRTPISPLLRTDGVRWYNLFRRLKTQTKLYTWGQGLKGNLGQGVAARIGARTLRYRGGPRPTPSVFQRVNSTWPTEAHVPDEIGVVADIQCGGWSTVILSSRGRLYCTGSINGAALDPEKHSDGFQLLEYVTQSNSAVAQFSAGRSHILALTDDGEVISWDRIYAKGLKVVLSDRPSARPVRVAAGWGESSAYIPDVGIVYWQPLKNDQADEMLDTRVIAETTVPGTAEHVMADGTKVVVIAHILLEGYIVWITSSNEVWSCSFNRDSDEATEAATQPFRLPGFFDRTGALRDVQGSFRRFSVFTSDGCVLAGDVDYIQTCSNAARRHASMICNEDLQSVDPRDWSDLPDILATRPRDIPALQNSGIVAVRFGDYHYHALTNDGHILSFGEESQSCGALGLGNASQEGILRGMRVNPRNLNATLVPAAGLRGRRVWFEPEKRDWLRFLKEKLDEYTREPPNQEIWSLLQQDLAKQTMFSEWIEQEGRHWDFGPALQDHPVEPTLDRSEPGSRPSHLSNYFAIAIGAAGWHSGALVLLDEEKAERTLAMWIPAYIGHDAGRGDDVHHTDGTWISEGFPRVMLPDGSRFPSRAELGSGQMLRDAIRPWRYGMPTLHELGLPDA